MDYLIKGARIINEGKDFIGDVAINNGRIEAVGPSLNLNANNEINAEGKLLLPGLIDDQVHFREPGLTHKADIGSESKAAVAGGITSFMEMPNTNPQTVNNDELQKKFDRAAKSSWANYSFYLGATNTNLEDVKRVNTKLACGVKIFMGASTGNMLVDHDEILEGIFKSSPLIIATHCEDEETVKTNEAKFKEKHGDQATPEMHPIIRSREACYLSSSKAIELAKRTGANLHILHISTKEELDLFDADLPLEQKKITSEACTHHLWFESSQYAEKGNFIKWNPAVKDLEDREAIRKGVINGNIDVLATDHAPHTLEEKNRPLFQAPSGGPLVQHQLPALLELVDEGVFDIQTVVQKACHNVAIRFHVKDRGYIREGYWADLVLVDTNSPWSVSKENILYKCGWSPFEGHNFKNRITQTFISGNLVFDQGTFASPGLGKALEFNR